MPDPKPETEGLAGRLRALAEEVLEGTEMYLVELDLRGQKGSRVVDVYVDADEGVGVDDLAKVSRELAFLLDAEDVIAGRYNLNVSSPGADRPLVEPRQYRKHVGRALEVAMAEEDGSEKTLRGELVAADETTITLATSKKKTQEIRYQDITQAKVLLPW